MKTLTTLTLVAASGLALATNVRAQPQDIAFLYQASGQAGAIHETLVIDENGAAVARSQTGRTSRSGHAFINPKALSRLQSELAKAMHGALGLMPGCEEASADSMHYTLGLSKNGQLETRTTCDPAPISALLADVQMVMQQVLAERDVTVRLGQFELDVAGPAPGGLLARGITVYADGRVATWSRDAAGLRSLEFDDHLLPAGVLRELRGELHHRHDTRFRGESLDPSLPAPDPGNGGPVKIRLFDSDMDGSVLVFGNANKGGGGVGGGVTQAILARL